jgi:hypothetical protein
MATERRRFAGRAVLALLLGLATLGVQASVPQPGNDHDVPGIRPAHLTADYWVRQLQHPHRAFLDSDALATQNAHMRAQDPALHDLAALPPELDATRIRAWIEDLSTRPTRTLYDADGRRVPDVRIDTIVENTALEAVPARQPTRYGMVVRRADLRAFPTALRVFNRPDDHDIDRFQESALFPGTPVVVAHASADGEWLFVVSETYAAWIEARHVAVGERDAVLAYGQRAPYLVVTGATARTVFTPEAPEVSDVQLEMGVRVPLRADWPGDTTVNGQHPFASHVVELPVRRADGTLDFAPALVPRSADVAGDYLPLTGANLVRQGFKFLGERYGWGHSYNARDCSGFVSEIYRSMGVLMPRNTRDQSVSPALDTLSFEGLDHERRLELLRDTRVGDLVYIPGHVMMVVGHEDGMPYVIHDTSGMTWRRDDGSLRRLALNGVVVTPLLPMLSDADTPTVDRITTIQRMRP